MKIFIHEAKGSFSDRWMEYCREKGIIFEAIDCFDTGIMAKVEAGDVLLWHWSHKDIRALTFARHIIAALQEKGVKVFPDIRTCWHYDDKVAQKYLLEAVGAPLVPSYVFYDKKEARRWIEQASFPKVFKLRRGAGSANVKLVKSRGEALGLIDTAFSGGFNPISGYFDDAQTKVRRIDSFAAFLSKLKRFPSIVMNTLAVRDQFPREKGYIYFQDFLPDNRFDTRVTIIGKRAFGFIRHVRPDDFRASGSGSIDHDPQKIDKRCIKAAFDTAKRINSQSLAFDFIFDGENDPLIGEVSYCYAAYAINDCQGYWDQNLNWSAGHFRPEDLIIEDLLLL
jgi:glutathione synthase/RimK-type ligase-like ATP-grasp enzyme